MLIDWISIGHDENDDIETRRIKSVVVIIIVIMMIKTVATLSFTVDRSTLLKGFDVLILVTAASGLLILHATRSLPSMFNFLWPIILIVQFCLVLLNGNSEGDILPFFVIPAAVVLVMGPAKSKLWFGVSFSIFLVFPFIEPLLPDVMWQLHQTEANPSGSLFSSAYRRPVAVNEGLAMAVGSFFIYFLTYSGHKKLESANELILAQKGKLEQEHVRSINVLENILPAPIAERLQNDPDSVIADDYDRVTVLFADIVGFTPRASKMTAKETVSFLNSVFRVLIDWLKSLSWRRLRQSEMLIWLSGVCLNTGMIMLRPSPKWQSICSKKPHRMTKNSAKAFLFGSASILDRSLLVSLENADISTMYGETR